MFELFKIGIKLLFTKKIQQILVIFQNNNELRGGGGFITQVLDISIGQRKIKMNFRHDHKELRGDIHIDPPADIKKFLGLKHWHFRDTNLFGDFTKNAESISKNYQTIYKNKQVAGVIAVNFTLIEKILNILGKIKLDGKIITGQNIFSELTHSVSDVDHHNLEDLNNRKSLLKKIFSSLSGKIFLRFWKWPTLGKLLQASFRNKDLQIHFFEDKFQQKLFKKGLIENFSSNGSKDFLAIVENNYLGLKTNRYLRRMVFHDVQFFLNPKNKTLSEATVKVKIRTEHFGSFNYPMSGTYQSVIDIFIPKSATNIQTLTEGMILNTISENNFQTLSIHKILTIGATSEIIFQYQLPAELFSDNSYSFRYIKQSGVQHEHLFETVIFPDQYELEANTKQATLLESKMFLNHPNLESSYDYTVTAKFHQQSLRIFFHEIIEPSLIQIRFNEPVFFIENTSPSEQIKIIDLQNGQEYQIEKTHFANDNRHLFIKVPSLPRLEECFYRLQLTNIENQIGTPLHQPKQVTVVYRSSKFKAV